MSVSVTFRQALPNYNRKIPTYQRKADFILVNFRAFYFTELQNALILLDSHLPPAKPTAISDMSRVEIDAELMKGIDSLKSGKTYTADEVDAELAKEFDV